MWAVNKTLLSDQGKQTPVAISILGVNTIKHILIAAEIIPQDAHVCNCIDQKCMYVTETAEQSLAAE